MLCKGFVLKFNLLYYNYDTDCLKMCFCGFNIAVVFVILRKDLKI